MSQEAQNAEETTAILNDGRELTLSWLVPDQALDPGAAAWLDYRHPAVPPERNLFYAVYGFEAPAGQDPVAEGRRLAGEVNRDLERLLHAEQAPKSPEAGADIERRWKGKPLSYATAVGDLCRFRDQPCLDWVRQHAEQIAAAAEENRELLDRYYAEVAATGDLPSDQFLTRYRRQRSLEPDDRLGWTDWVTDPIGCVLFGVAQPDAYVYGIRIHDIEGLITLVNLNRAALAQGIKSEDLPQFLAASRERFHDPYTGSPISWDAEAGELYFVSPNTKSRYNRLRCVACSAPTSRPRAHPARRQPMKIHFEIEATPQELRTFFGLPDVEPLQKEMLDMLREKMFEGAAGFDPASLMKPFLTPQMQTLEAMQKAFSDAWLRAATGGEKKT